MFNHKSKQHISEKESISTNIFSFLSFEITSAIFSLCPPDVPTRNVSPNFTIDYRIQIEFDGCGDDQKLGDVQFPSQRHGTTLQTAQRQFIAPCWESIGDRALGGERKRELEHLVGRVARGESDYVPGSGEAREERALREGQRVLLGFVPHRYR